MPSSPRRRAGASTAVGELLAVGRGVFAHDSAPELVVLGEQAAERAALGLEARVVDRRLRRPDTRTLLLRGRRLRNAVHETGAHVDERCGRDRKSTRLNSSHGYISYAVFCLKKKKK